MIIRAYVKRCPNIKDTVTNLTWETPVPVTSHDCLIKKMGKISTNEILLDNHSSSISIIKPEMLLCVKHAENPAQMSRVGGVQVIAYDVGYLQN